MNITTLKHDWDGDPVFLNMCKKCGKTTFDIFAEKIQVEFGDPVTYECEDKASTFFEDVKLNYFFKIPFLRGNLAVSSFFPRTATAIPSRPPARPQETSPSR